MKQDFKSLQDSYWNKDQTSRRSPFHPCVQSLFEPRADFLYDLNNDENISVLELGSGNGYFSVYLEKRFKNLLATDSSKNMLSINPSRNKALACAQDLPFDNNSFDIVTCSHLIHHLDENDQVKSLIEMGRVARNKVIVYEPYRNNPLNFLFGLLVKEERESLKFSKSYIRKQFIKSGFQNPNIVIEGCTLPNKAPKFWAPIGKYLNKTFIRKFGFYIRVVVDTKIKSNSA